MTPTVELQNAINGALVHLRPGSLSFWGNWFGKPYDNIHQIVSATAIDHAITVSFDYAETLIVEDPLSWSMDDGCLKIRNARKVRWQWFFYGVQPTVESLQFEEYRMAGRGKLDFATSFQPGRRVTLDPDAPAVELHSRS